MGLLLNGLMYVFKEIAERADQEMNDDEAVKADLMALHAALEAGSISEEDFEARELELVTRLQEIEERKAPRRPIVRKPRVARRRARARGPIAAAPSNAPSVPPRASTPPTSPNTEPAPDAERASPPSIRPEQKAPAHGHA